MKAVAPLLGAVALSSCTMGPAEPLARTDSQQARLTSLTAGKVAGAPVSCLSTYRSGDMIVIDENTVAFRDGARRVYVSNMQGPCGNLGRGGTALVTRNPSGQLCSGDIAHVVDVTNRIPIGSCAFGPFVPYTRAGS